MDENKHGEQATCLNDESKTGNSNEFAQAFGTILPTPTVGTIVGEKQGAVMDAVHAYNEAVEAARVLEPHVNRVKLVIDILDESPRCFACGGKVL